MSNIEEYFKKLKEDVSSVENIKYFQLSRGYLIKADKILEQEYE